MLWKTISIRRGVPVRRPSVVMSITPPRSSAASIACFVAAIRERLSALRRVYSLADVGQRHALAAGIVEIVPRQPCLESRAPGGPLTVGDGEPRGVAVSTLDHAMPPEDALEGEPEPLRGSA